MSVNRKCQLVAALAVGVILAAAAPAAGLESYTIVRTEALPETDAFVLGDIRGLLARGLGGVEVPVCAPDAAPAAKRIFFGIPSPDFDVASLADQERVVDVRDGDVYLFGGGTNGTRYAAYGFLQDVLGYKFFDMRGGIAVPDLKMVALTNCVRRRRFDFENRSSSCWSLCNGEKSAMFMFRHGMNGVMDGAFEGFIERECGGRTVSDFREPWPASHATAVYLPRNLQISAPPEAKKLAGGDLEKLHPEYFTLQGGKRVFGHQRCLSNPGARELLKKALFAKMALTKEPSYFDCSAGDTPGRFCECAGCVALEEKYGTPAGPLLDAVLEFCPEAARLYPRHCIKMLVYRKEQTQRPPKNVARLPDNFVTDFAPIDDDFSKDWTDPCNADTLADMRKWCGMGRRTLVWYYPNTYGGITPPLGNVERLANDMRIMKEAGVTGLNMSHSVGVPRMTGFTELQSYLIMRLWDDSSQDWRRLVREFLDFEYGAAADGVAAYLSELEGLRKGMKTWLAWDASRSLAYYDYLTPENIMRWEGDFDRMERLLADDRVRLRSLRRIRYNLDNALVAKMREVSVAFGNAAPKIEDVVERIETIAAEIAEDCYYARHEGKAKAFVKSVKDRLFMKKLAGSSGASGLPEDIFGGFKNEDIYIVLPVSHDGGRHPDPVAAYGIAAMYEGVKSPEAMKMPFVTGFDTVLPNKTHRASIGRGVDADNIGPRGEYRFYDMGELVVTQDCYIRLGDTYWFQASISEAFVAGTFNKARIYASLKFKGPAFYPDDTKSKNQVWCDRVVVVRE